MFSEYKKYPYKVRFNDDNIFYLSSNQRAKLQYHILSQYFDLVKVDEQDKEDLYRFCKDYQEETAQRWLYRMKYEDGHEKIMTFGVSLDVRKVLNTSKLKGIYCYTSEITDTQATYKGV